MHSALDLLSDYAAYHRDRRNIVTHFVGVPLIVFALGVLLARPAVHVGELLVTPAWLAFAAASAWYLSRHAVLGLATSVGVGAMILLAHQLPGHGLGSTLGWGLSCFFVGSLFQLLGHWYEGRSPAFVKDLTSLLVAPMFVVAEWLFMLGWNKPMQDGIEARVGPTHLRDLAHPA